MDLDSAKENIQPLAGGRDARQLEVALNAEHDPEVQQQLLKQRREKEKAISEFEGDDPLELWFEYISWIEQSYPSGGKENGLGEVLYKCLLRCEHDERYRQDKRLIKLYIKYIDSQPNPQDYYLELYNNGIGTMVADLYICWALYYDLIGNFKRADAVYKRGMDAKAQPLEDLEQAYTHFGFTMSQRILNQDEDSQRGFISSLMERRHALTSLKSKKKNVGSIRTGAAVKSYNPGKIEVEGRKDENNVNSNFAVFHDEKSSQNFINSPEEGQCLAVFQSIVNEARKGENVREPGPWSNAKIRQVSRLFSRNEETPLQFKIMEDNEIIPLQAEQNMLKKGIQLGDKHVTKNLPQKKWDVPITREDDVSPNAYPCYDKFSLYPYADQVFSPEELYAFKWYKQKVIYNDYVREKDAVWTNDISAGIRLFPQFSKKNEPQRDLEFDHFVPEEILQQGDVVLGFNISEIYPPNGKNEFQLEEILAARIRNGERTINFDVNETIVFPRDMDETICNFKPRQSIFPHRLSIAPRGMGSEQKTYRATVESRKSVMPLQTRTIPENDITDEISKNVQCLKISNSTKMRENMNENRIVLKTTVPESSIPSKNDILSLQGSCQSSHTPETSNSSITITKPNALENFERPNDSDFHKTITDVGSAVSSKNSPCNGNEPFKSPEAVFGVHNANRESLPSIPDRKSLNDGGNLGTSSSSKVPVEVRNERPANKGGVANVADDKTAGISTSPMNNPGLFEETCSTQTFNFYIKAAALSTPKGKVIPEAIRQPDIPESSDESPQLKSTSTANTRCTMNFADMQRKLSTIIETSEFNTGCSTSNASSSTKLLSIHPSKKASPNSETIAPINPVQGKKSLGAIPKLRHKSEKIVDPDPPAKGLEKTLENSMTLKSLQVFEEGTQTIPKMLLIKPQGHADDFCDLFTKTPETKRFKAGFHEADFFEEDSALFSNSNFNTEKQKSSDKPKNSIAQSSFAQKMCGKVVVSKNAGIQSDDSVIPIFEDVEYGKTEVKTENHQKGQNLLAFPENICQETRHSKRDSSLKVKLEKQSLHIYDVFEQAEWEESIMEDDNRMLDRLVEISRCQDMNTGSDGNVDDDNGQHQSFDTSGLEVNPFCKELQERGLRDVEFFEYIENCPTCELANHIPNVQAGKAFQVNDEKFDVLKYITKGAYGSIYCGRSQTSGQLFAIKQEKPSNYWEYYICIKIHNFLLVEEMSSGFMKVEYAKIGPSSSVLVSTLSKYGSLLAISNEYRKARGKTLDEYIVMVLASQMFMIIDHLHSLNVIHADLKADNFLLMDKLSYVKHMAAPSIKLIDFGVAIDMSMFPEDQVFRCIPYKKDPLCTENIDGRDWTYQCDMFGLAGTIHTLLFGSYMKVEKRGPKWYIKTIMPRYFNKIVWTTIFDDLLNIESCKMMPNLQSLRSMLIEAIDGKESYVQDKLREFNVLFV